jgi:hypothetical protein
MIISIITIISILELSIFLAISRRVEFYNPILIFVAISVFYANSFFLDYFIFNQEQLELASMGQILLVDSLTYLVIVLLTFFFIIGVYFVFLAKSIPFNAFYVKRKTQIIEFDLINNYNWLKLMTIFFCLFYIFFLINQIFGLSRNDIKDFSTPIRSMLSSVTFMFLCFSLMYKWRFKSLNILILLTLTTYSILSFERENILLIIFTLVVNRPPLRLSVLHILFCLLLVGLMFFYKPLVWIIIGLINGQGVEMSHLPKTGLRFTSLDPAASLLMLSDFIYNGLIFMEYSGSYFVNTIMQIVRMISDVHWVSLGNFSTEHYTNGKMGTAFSMIIESILNFGYFGPLFTGFIITYLFFKTDKINNIYYKLHYFIWFLFILKFIRTELAVVLKLYILPALIAYLFFVYVTKKNRSNMR